MVFVASPSKRAICQVVGQGGFLLLVLLALLSGALFGDLEETKYYQTPLVLTFDLGLLAGFALCLGCVRRIDATRLPFTHLVAAAVVLVFGLSASVMARAGMLFDGAPIDLLVGDGLLGVFLALAAALWWLVLMEGDALVVALYQVPAFDYMDFRIRTIFGGAGLLVLVLLLLGPMHRVYEVVRGREEAEALQVVGVAGLGAVAEEGGVTLSASDQRELAEQRLHAFAEAYHLSLRESEIVGLVSQGRDVPYIEQELVLSKSTVKTHIRHIYEKCGVSSRQDLLDLLQDFGEEG